MFSEDTYYAAFKQVRNKFRKYSYHELIGESLGYINAPAKDDIESSKRHPWLVLMFVKWVLLDDSFPNKNAKLPTSSEVNAILQLVYELSEKLRMPNEYEHVNLFFRNIAFQQFIYQIDFYYAHLSRQSILFSGLDKNHYICKAFRENTGLEIQEFLDLSLATLTRFLNTNEVVMPDTWFSSVYNNYSPRKVANFLSSISKDINQIRNDLKQKDNGRRLSTEHYELTSFIEYPLIKVQNKYFLTHRKILFRRFEYFVYDTLREIDAAKFMDKFGGLFERYVEKSIKYSEERYFTEIEIKKELGAIGNQIDFLIQGGDANVFIDAKAVEMSSHGRTTHSSEILQHATKNSILKAIKQSHDVIKKISESKSTKIQKSENNYLLVVTYKELHLGNGTTYYEVINKDKIDDIYDEYKEYPCIPPENMYFITIDDLDILTSILKEESDSLLEILDKIKEKDKRPESRKFDFRLHLVNLDTKAQTSNYLVNEKDIMFDRIINAVNSRD